jgi:2',3'-cyclic-nucleotide 2'-phosphodiesterase (5'-nucleotidase family)
MSGRGNALLSRRAVAVTSVSLILFATSACSDPQPRAANTTTTLAILATNPCHTTGQPTSSLSIPPISHSLKIQAIAKKRDANASANDYASSALISYGGCIAGLALAGFDSQGRQIISFEVVAGTTQKQMMFLLQALRDSGVFDLVSERHLGTG